jgi:hypothetical protein
MPDQENGRLGYSVDSHSSYRSSSGPGHNGPIRKINYIGSLCVIIAAGALIVLATYWMIFPTRNQIVIFDSPKIEVMYPRLVAGQVQPIRHPFTKYIAAYPVIHTRIIDSVSYQMDTRVGSTGVGRADGWFYSLTIPPVLPPRKYRIEKIFEFKLNPLRTEYFRLISDEFEVAK